MTTVRITHVAKRYGRTVALADVSAGIDPGITGLLGPNGAGKTTLLKSAAVANHHANQKAGSDSHRR